VLKADELSMAIQIRVAGVFGGTPLHETFEEAFKENDTPKKIFSRLDKKKQLGRKFFGRVVKGGRATVLLNGGRLDSPQALDAPLQDGDEISIISAIAGG
jgi:molybdopterin converting factor small subunit